MTTVTFHTNRFTNLPDDCLRKIASSWTTGDRNQDVLDVVALASCGKSVAPLVKMIVDTIDPLSTEEMTIRHLCEGIDEDDALGLHEDHGQGIWKARRGVTIDALKGGCRNLGLLISGPKDRLISRLRRAWKRRGLGCRHPFLSTSTEPFLRRSLLNETKIWKQYRRVADASRTHFPLPMKPNNVL